MTTRFMVGAAIAALMISGCNQIRLPGAPEPEAETTAIDTAEMAAPETAEPEIVEAPERTLPEPLDADTELAEADVRVGIEMAIGPPALPILDAPESSPEIADLAAVNAALCGLPIQPLEETPTFAEQTGAKPADPNRIGAATINGVAASLYDFPGLVKMEPREYLPSGAIATGHCGATRIAEQWFLTAAHCLDEDFDEVTLVVDSETLSSPLAKRINATASVCHAGYGGAGYNYINDIALVRIDEGDVAELSRVPIAKFGATAQIMAPYNYGDAKMAGWGLTTFQSELSDHLLSATIRMDKAGPAALDFLSQDGAGPCVGDSGGPVYVTEADGSSTMVGLLSIVEPNLETGRFCEGEYMARYTNVQGYQNWIESVIETCESGLGLCGY